ncbi:MAG TPA: HPF/RaiA family ribosome-associated protein [Terracidiphilus sp.]|jgi:putative sigma-54 modulation protein|nr:HPF/RaiA family ribosome-associated protein [Terracidiphilus sp.]
MEMEFTARQVKISRALRTQAEDGLQRIARILGKGTHASITFSAQRHVQIAELIVKGRLLKLAAAGKADTLESALRQALAHAEHQALRYRDRRLVSKRLPKVEKVLAAPPVARPKARVSPIPEDGENGAVGTKAKARTSIAVHSFPASPTVVEPHIVKNGEAVALRPMTIEEAVKDAEFRDRDLLIFRNPSGDVFVLHRRRDGQMELVEIP